MSRESKAKKIIQAAKNGNIAAKRRVFPIVFSLRSGDDDFARFLLRQGVVEILHELFCSGSNTDKKSGLICLSSLCVFSPAIRERVCFNTKFLTAFEVSCFLQEKTRGTIQAMHESFGFLLSLLHDCEDDIINFIKRNTTVFTSMCKAITTSKLDHNAVICVCNILQSISWDIEIRTRILSMDKNERFFQKVLNIWKNNKNNVYPSPLRGEMTIGDLLCYSFYHLTFFHNEVDMMRSNPLCKFLCDNGVQECFVERDFRAEGLHNAVMLLSNLCLGKCETVTKMLNLDLFTNLCNIAMNKMISVQLRTTARMCLSVLTCTHKAIKRFSKKDVEKARKLLQRMMQSKVDKAENKFVVLVIRTRIQVVVEARCGIERQCGGCGKRLNKDMKKCSKCRNRYYCSKKCQKKDWKSGHKYVCKEPDQNAERPGKRQSRMSRTVDHMIFQRFNHTFLNLKKGGKTLEGSVVLCDIRHGKLKVELTSLPDLFVMLAEPIFVEAEDIIVEQVKKMENLMKEGGKKCWVCVIVRENSLTVHLRRVGNIGEFILQVVNNASKRVRKN